MRLFSKIARGLFFLGVVSHGVAMSQTASNWTTTSCDGSSHELYADLDGGKVVVMIWVMPCAECTEGSLSAQSAVQSANALHPGKVVYYVADDYGNTDCTLLGAWCASNGVSDAIIISDKLVSMNPYGAAGMPKVIVVGGKTHKVVYNQNGPDVTEAGIRAAIDLALAEPTGLKEIAGTAAEAVVYPNPTANTVSVSLEVTRLSDVSVELLDDHGRVIRKIFCDKVSKGKKDFIVHTDEFENGNYIVRTVIGNSASTQRIIVKH